jgi:hypothetical protein
VRAIVTRVRGNAQASANAAEKKNEELLGTLQSKLSSLKSVSAVPGTCAAPLDLCPGTPMPVAALSRRKPRRTAGAVTVGGTCIAPGNNRDQRGSACAEQGTRDDAVGHGRH